MLVDNDKFVVHDDIHEYHRIYDISIFTLCNYNYIHFPTSRGINCTPHLPEIPSCLPATTPMAPSTSDSPGAIALFLPGAAQAPPAKMVFQQTPWLQGTTEKCHMEIWSLNLWACQPLSSCLWKMHSVWLQVPHQPSVLLYISIRILTPFEGQVRSQHPGVWENQLYLVKSKV